MRPARVAELRRWSGCRSRSLGSNCIYALHLFNLFVVGESDKYLYAETLTKVECGRGWWSWPKDGPKSRLRRR